MAVVKVIELIGSSPNSWEEATRNAVAKAAETKYHGWGVGRSDRGREGQLHRRVEG